jgi:hypothetical protein
MPISEAKDLIRITRLLVPDRRFAAAKMPHFIKFPLNLSIAFLTFDFSFSRSHQKTTKRLPGEDQSR